MAETTKIAWATSTWNPWIGCSKVASGCLNCYAEADFDRRRKRVVWGPHGTRVKTSDAYWKKPLKWNREAGTLEHLGGTNRPRVFPSLCDPFEQLAIVEWYEFSPGYRVSIYGEVQSQWRTGGHRVGDWKPLEAHKGKGGYMLVNLGFDGHARTRRVHNLVLESFVGPRPTEGQCRHMDGNATNNHLWNLAWGTSKENHADRHVHGTSARGERNGRAKLTRQQADDIRSACAAGESQASVSRRFRISQSVVSNIVLGKFWVDRPTPKEVSVYRNATIGQVLTHDGQPLFVDGNGVTVTPDAASRPCTLDDLRQDMFKLIDATPNIDWLLLTKRPENILRMWPSVEGRHYVAEAGAMNDYQLNSRDNVWLIYSAADQESLEAGLPHLLKCRDLVPVLGLSLEPLLGPINLRLEDCWTQDDHYELCERLNWVIVGGESGPNARPCALEWIDDIRRQCEAANTPCFIKQMGSNPITENANVWDFDYLGKRIGAAWGRSAAGCKINFDDIKGGNPDEWPEEFRVQQFPK